MPSDDAVGYKKPPVHTRFKPGQSGNLKGRPKGTKNLETDLREELSERIVVREGRTERRISKQRALLKSLTAKAIKGDTRAATVLFNMILRVLEAAPNDPDTAPLTAEEREVIEALEQRLRCQAETGREPPPAERKRPRRRLAPEVE